MRGGVSVGRRFFSSVGWFFVGVGCGVGFPSVGDFSRVFVGRFSSEFWVLCPQYREPLWEFEIEKAI